MQTKILDNNNLPEWLPFGASLGKSGKIEYSESEAYSTTDCKVTAADQKIAAVDLVKMQVESQAKAVKAVKANAKP
jgi:hypothetical protein